MRMRCRGFSLPKHLTEPHKHKSSLQHFTAPTLTSCCFHPVFDMKWSFHWILFTTTANHWDWRHISWYVSCKSTLYALLTYVYSWRMKSHIFMRNKNIFPTTPFFLPLPNFRLMSFCLWLYLTTGSCHFFTIWTPPCWSQTTSVSSDWY